MFAVFVISFCLSQSGDTAGPVAAPSSQTPPSSAADEVEHAKRRFSALVAALRTYEAALTGLAWDQEVTVEPLPRGSGKRFVAFKTSFVVVPDGRWSIQSRRVVFTDDKATEIEERFMFDGKNVLAADPKGHSGIIRGHDGIELHESLLSPLMLVGGSHVERVSSPWMNRLSDKLIGLSDVAVDESAAPMFRLSGSRYQGGKWERVEVTLDGERGYMPVRYARTLELFDILREEVAVTASEQVGVLWLPTAGTRVIYGLKPTEESEAMAPEQQEELETACNDRIAAAGLSREKYADRLKIGEIMRSIFKFDMIRADPLGGGRDILRAWNLKLVTAEDADKTLVQPFSEGDRIMDSRNGDRFTFMEGKLVPVKSKESSEKP